MVAFVVGFFRKQVLST